MLCIAILVGAARATFGNSQLLYFADSEKEVSITQASLGTTYENITDSTREFHFIYKLKVNSLPPTAARLRTEILSDNITNNEIQVRLNMLNCLPFFKPFCFRRIPFA